MPGTKKYNLSDCLGLMSGASEDVKKSFARAWKMRGLELPACVVKVNKEGCQGLRKAGGLWLQCSKKVVSGGFCTTCRNSFVDEGKPKHGLYATRIGEEEWKTVDGKRALTFMEYLKQEGLDRSAGEEFLSSRGIESLPENEWEVREPERRRRGSAVSDTSSEGGEKERTTSRFLPLEGKKKSPPKGESFKGKNGAMLRVHVYKESKRVVKVNVGNWTDAANARFTELYGGDGGNEGQDYGRKKSKKDDQSNQMAAMQAQIAALMARNKELEEGQKEEKIDAPKAPVAKKQNLPTPETKSSDDKKKKAEKKAAEKAAAKKKLQEEMAAKMAALDEEDDELGDFSDEEDEEEAEMNPYEHNGTTYHRDEETDYLYTEEGDFWGHITEEGTVVEGEPEESEE